jgi:hypothetical protein
MMKHFVEGVPRCSVSYSHDCLHNALASLLSYMGYNINIVQADYLSFMHSRENGCIGLNYLIDPSAVIISNEEELNTSMEFIYLPLSKLYSSKNTIQPVVKHEEYLTIERYVNSDREEAYARTKELIDEGNPVIVAIDLYHMPYHKYCNARHALHFVVITGYDEEEGVFQVFDKNVVTASDFDGKLGIEEVMEARSSDYIIEDGKGGEYTRSLSNVWIEAEVGKDFKISDGRLANIFKESYKRMSGEKDVLGYKCGLAAIKLFRESISDMKQEGPDDRKLYLFRTYYNENFKLISRGRKRFREYIKELNGLVPADLIASTSEYLEQSAVHWDICANLCIKFGITRSVAMLDNMAKQLQLITEIEQGITDNLYHCISRV